MDRLDQLERMTWISRSSPRKLPKRLCKFCLFAVILPIVCLIVPIYVRFQALRPHYFTLSPSDMRLLNQESSMSTVWCQGQELRMNATFNAYLLSSRPRLRRYRHHVNMRRHMLLEDDIKEYWGFYLIRGSVVRLSVCARHEGASFIVVKGLKDARRCSYLGELDSAEESSDDISDEFEFTHNIVGEHNGANDSVTGNADKADMIAIKGEVHEDMKALETLSKQELLRKYLAAIKGNRLTELASGDDQEDEDPQRVFKAYQVRDQATEAQEQLTKLYQDVRATELEDADDEDGATAHEDLYDLQDQGQFDQHDENDLSRDEVRSSWSSSEEALVKCEGLIYNVPLSGGLKCTPQAELSTVRNISTEVSLDVKETGFYYFIFANENEITDNFLSATFDLHKTVFDVSDNVGNCTNSTECSLPLSFWSHEHVVLEVPEETHVDNEESRCQALLGYSSLQECHWVVLAESVCQPRRAIYMVFFMLVPVLILVFAYI